MAMPTQEWHKALAEYIAEHMKGLEGTEIEGWTIKIKDVSLVEEEGTPKIFVTIEDTDQIEGETFVQFEMKDENGPLC